MTAPTGPRQIVTPGAPPKPDADGVITFGRRSHQLGAPPRRFRIEVEGARETGGPVERWEEEFSAHLDLDGGAVLQLMNARDQGEQARKTASLLITSVIDTDGVPHDYYPFPATVDDLEDGTQLPLHQEDGTTIVVTTEDDGDGGERDALWLLPAGTELAYDDEGAAALPETAERLYRSWRGGVETDGQIVWDELADGSSKRRLMLIMASDSLRVDFSFLEQIANWLIGDATARPTGRPARLVRGPQRT